MRMKENEMCLSSLILILLENKLLQNYHVMVIQW